MISPALAALLPLAALHAQSLEPDDRIRLAEAFALGDEVRDLWPGWERAPFAVLLIRGEYEYLIRHPDPTEDFTSLGFDEMLQGEVFARPRTFNPGLLATFPAVRGVPTVVIGGPEDTGKTSTSWVVVVLHEHFHQLQYSQPTYYDELAALDLAGDDQSGMWALNYPFPYADPAVADVLDGVASALLKLLDTPKGGDDRRLPAYDRRRDDLRAALEPADHRYMSFQLWQEGVARYTELMVATRAARSYEPSPAFRALPDYVPFAEVRQELRDVIDRELRAGPVELQRVFFYGMGAAEALVLDRLRPDWKTRYWREMFTPERHFAR